MLRIGLHRCAQRLSRWTAKRVQVSSGELVQGLAAELIRRLMMKWDKGNRGLGNFSPPTLRMLGSHAEAS